MPPVARKPRIEFNGAIYHIINRGNYSSEVFATAGASQSFEKTLFATANSCGWIIGGKEYKKHLSEELKRMKRARSWGREELREMNEFFWVRQLTECLEALRKSEEDIGNDLKSARWKIAIACWLKDNTSASNGWMGQHLAMGIASAVSRNVAQLQRSGPRRYADYRKVEKHLLIGICFYDRLSDMDDLGCLIAEAVDPQQP